MNKKSEKLWSNWEPSSYELFGYPCLELKKKNVLGKMEIEYCIFGQSGQIFEYNQDFGTCIKYHANGDESSVRFKKDQLLKYVNKIMAPISKDKQMELII